MRVARGVGRLSSRLTLMLCNKQKLGLEKTEYRNIGHVKEAFQSEVLAASGGRVPSTSRTAAIWGAPAAPHTLAELGVVGENLQRLREFFNTAAVRSHLSPHLQPDSVDNCLNSTGFPSSSSSLLNFRSRLAKSRSS